MHTYLEKNPKAEEKFIRASQENISSAARIDYVTSIVEQFPGYMYIKEANSRKYLTCTNAIVKILGLSEIQEVIYKSNKDIINYFGHKSILPLIELIEQHEELVINNNAVYSGILSEPFINANGHVTQLEMKFSPIMNEWGNVAAVQFYAVDISNKKSPEELLKLYNIMYPSQKIMLHMFLEHIGFSKHLVNNCSITKRELDILLMFSTGKTAKEIARAVSLSPRTVEKHLDKIKEKVDVKNRIQLMRTFISCFGG